MCSNYNISMKVVIIVLTLVSSISLGLSSNTIPNSLNFNKFAFAQQNPVLPNYKAIVPSKMLNNQQMDLASSDIQQKSLIRYQPITPAVHDYIGSSNSKSINSFPTLTTTNILNSTSPSSFIQPVSLTQYHPITPVSLTNPLPSPENIGNEHASTNDGDGGSHHRSSNDNGSHHSSSNDNGRNGESHSGDAHHGSSSNHHNSNDHGSHGSHGSHGHGGHSSSHASASASAGGGHASASASAD